jgi:hypothetical protein
MVSRTKKLPIKGFIFKLKNHPDNSWFHWGIGNVADECASLHAARGGGTLDCAPECQVLGEIKLLEVFQ